MVGKFKRFGFDAASRQGLSKVPVKIYQDWPLRLKYRDHNFISRVKRSQADQGGICCKHVQMSTARCHDPVDATTYGWGGL